MVQALEILDDNLSDAEMAGRLIPLLRNQGRSLYHTIETLFQWATSQQGGAVPHPREFDASIEVAVTLELLRSQSSDKAISLVSYVPNQTRLLCDCDHFLLIIRNLVSNAIKFSKANGVVAVRVRMHGDGVMFSVSDEGVGMSEEQLSMFGEPGMKRSFGTKGEEGSGLGLQLIKNLLTTNGGKMWATSTLGKGSTIYFSLPSAK